MRQRTIFVVLVFALVLGVPSAARAQVELTGVIGGLLGGDLDNILAGNVSIQGAFDNGPLYGVRLGWIGGFVGVEGSFVGSPSGINVSAPNQSIGINGKVYYLEGKFLVIPIPGPVSPFFAAGLGMHSYTLDVRANALSVRLGDVQKLGYTFGGGIKINIKALTLRGEVHDHLTTIGPDDFNLGPVAAELVGKQTIHNVEISGGVGIRF